MIVRFAGAFALLSIAVVIAAFGLQAGAVHADKTIHVGDRTNNSLEEVQDACLSQGGAITSWTFVINQINGPKPDPVVVEFDTDGDGVADQSVEVSPGPQGGPRTAHYTVTGSGVVVDAFTDHAPDDWNGQFVLSHVDCGPPTDACAPFADRTVIVFNVRLGDDPTVVQESTPVAVNIAAGTYAVTLQSFDAHSMHGGQGQFFEQWFARFTVGTTTVDSGTIDDLPDDQDVLNQAVGNITFADTATQVVARHALAGGTFPTAESIEAVCVALDPVN